MTKNRKVRTYQRMYETRGVRPYYTVPHLGIYGKPFKKMTGFEYKDIIYITSSGMNNTAYFEIGEMEKSTGYFTKIWKDCRKTRVIINKIREIFKDATRVEKWAWRQKWSSKSDRELVRAALKVYPRLFAVGNAHIISQPQHMVCFEKKINELLEPFQEKEELLRGATYFSGVLPQTAEEKEIKKISKRWKRLNQKQKNELLQGLVKKYGWINEVEGDVPYDRNHYRGKIINFKEEKEQKSSVKIPKDILKIGQIIGELGFLRFWSRYHMLHTRYHLKKILERLIKRSSSPILEFATVGEITDLFRSKKVDLNEIGKRKKGYSSFLKNGHTVIVTGERAKRLKKNVKEDLTNVKEIKGTTANKGKVVGRVRIISFIAKNYNQQVANFKQGEILVTGMTRPQIVHLCKKADAIVTDEGGITSHAAVVGREFNLPCIIGTRNATKILKNGDLVEVDANKGIVKIIKK